ncbi:MAG: hypothetical protein WDN44_00165 [Sphingomonas sp.]
MDFDHAFRVRIGRHLVEAGDYPGLRRARCLGRRLFEKWEARAALVKRVDGPGHKGRVIGPLGTDQSFRPLSVAPC